MKKHIFSILPAIAAFVFAGCATPPPPTVVWKLPPNLGKAKSEIGIRMYGPMKTDGGQLDPGLAQQFTEAVQTKMIQSKRFHVYLPNQFGEMQDAGDADVIVKPFVDIIKQPMRSGGREVVVNICKVALDVKVFDKDGGTVKDAINLDGVAKVEVPSVFGKPARDVDVKGLVVKAYEEAYRLLEREINMTFPPAANAVGLRMIAMPPPPGWKQGEPLPEPMVKVSSRGGANIGFKQNMQFMLFAMVEGAPVIVALLEPESIMEEKAAFKTVQVNTGDPEAWGFWQRMKAGEISKDGNGLIGVGNCRLLVTPYFN